MSTIERLGFALPKPPFDMSGYRVHKGMGYDTRKFHWIIVNWGEGGVVAAQGHYPVQFTTEQDANEVFRELTELTRERKKAGLPERHPQEIRDADLR